MAKVNVVIVDATGNKEQKVGLPDDIKCGIIPPLALTATPSAISLSTK